MQKLWVLLSMMIFLGLYPFVHEVAWSQREQIRQDAPVGYLLPSRVTSLLSFGHEGLVSDFIFLKVATFVGGVGLGGGQISPSDWRAIEHGLDVVTDLDPYFVDPYFLAEGLFAWDARQPEVANRLLGKGIGYRKSDWRLPYFAGFNSFYFLGDYSRGAEYLARAAKIPGAPAFLGPLSARLYYYGGQSRTAILFLRGMLAEVNDEQMRLRLQKRLSALENAALIEDAAKRFEKDLGKKLTVVGDLVSNGYLEALPAEPYGGDWVLMPNGRVFSTSKFAESPPEKESGGEGR